MTTRVRMALLAGAAVMLLPTFAAAQVYVNPYVRRDGTQVEGHYRSAPDGNPYNNYSYPGNTNPYTGRVAPGDPDTYLREHDKGASSLQLNRRERRGTW
jgi:hypothetical protein